MAAPLRAKSSNFNPCKDVMDDVTESVYSDPETMASPSNIFTLRGRFLFILSLTVQHLMFKKSPLEKASIIIIIHKTPFKIYNIYYI